MRSEHSIKNAKFNLIFSVITIVLGFISRTFFIVYLGGIILGFNTLIAGVIGVLNIADLGIGVAINYELYKPLAEKNYKKISEVMMIFRRLYTYIAGIIFILGLCLIPFLNKLTKGEVPYHKAVIYFLILLITTSGTYLVSYKQTLANADQKAYLSQNVLGMSNIAKFTIQILVMWLFKNYLIWLLVGLVFNIGGNIYASRRVQRLYGDNIKFKANGKVLDIMKKHKNLTKNIKNIFFHKFATIVIYQTDPIVIAAFSSLKEIGVYANYSLVITSLNTLLVGVFNGFTASVGNLIASESTEKIHKVFKEMRFMTNSIGIILSFSLFMVIDKFILLWVGEGYLFNSTIVLVLILNFYVQVMRNTMDVFKDSYGIYWDIFAPIAESIINLILSIALSYKFGIVGVFIGTLISNLLIVIIWKPFVVYRYGFKMNVLKYYSWFIGNILLFGSISFLLYKGINKLDSMIFLNNNILNFLFTGIMSVVSISVILLILNIKNENLKGLVCRVRGLIFKR